MAGETRRKVLVIDNDRVASDMIVKTLLPRGLDVSVAASPDRGVEKAREYKPDLVFISLFFPDSNGLKISRRIHSEEGLKKVPLMMLISYRGELDPKYTSTIGIVDVLVKPLMPEDIIAKTKKVLGEQALTEKPAEEPGIFSEAGRDAVPLEEEGALRVEGHLSVSLPEEESPRVQALPQEHELDEAAKESNQALDETEEFLKEEADEEGQTPADKAATEFSEAGPPAAPIASEEEVLPGEGPRRFFSGRKLIVFAAVFAAVVLGLGTYGLKKIVSRTQKAAPAKVAVAGREKKAAVPDAAVDRPAVPAAGRRSEGVLQKQAGTEAGVQYRFTVQVGAFGSEKNAVTLVEIMKKKGFDAFVEKDPSKPLYRVLIGRFGNPKQASQQAKMLREEGLKAVVRPGKG
jgi:DNA-binding response OmpR family regulator